MRGELVRTTIQIVRLHERDVLAKQNRLSRNARINAGAMSVRWPDNSTPREATQSVWIARASIEHRNRLASRRLSAVVDLYKAPMKNVM